MNKNILSLYASIATLAFAIFGYYYYLDTSYKYIFPLIFLPLTIVISLQSSYVQHAISVLKGAREEFWKIVWPKKNEVTKKTIIVISLIFLTTLSLYVIDSFLFELINNTVLATR